MTGEKQTNNDAHDAINRVVITIEVVHGRSGCTMSILGVKPTLLLPEIAKPLRLFCGVAAYALSLTSCENQCPPRTACTALVAFTRPKPVKRLTACGAFAVTAPVNVEPLLIVTVIFMPRKRS